QELRVDDVGQLAHAAGADDTALHRHMQGQATPGGWCAERVGAWRLVEWDDSLGACLADQGERGARDDPAGGTVNPEERPDLADRAANSARNVGDLADRPDDIIDGTDDLA